MTVTLKTLADGRQFPEYEGEALSWSIGLYHTIAEQQKDFPKMRMVIRAMMEHRPDQLEQERREMIKGSFDRIFGHNAKTELRVIESELEAQHKLMQAFLNKSFVKRDYECTNVVACMAYKAPNENYIPADRSQVLQGLTMLWIESGVQYWGYL